MKKDDKDKILLETGTNEVQVLEFLIGERSYGVNVLKIKQLIKYEESSMVPIPDSHPAVMGTIVFQKESIAVLDLGTYLNIPTDREGKLQVVLICEFNNRISGFFIDDVKRMHRLSWNQIQTQKFSKDNEAAKITGICHIENRQVLLLDFETIVADVFGDTAFNDVYADVGDSQSKVSRKDIRLFLADDSVLVRKKVKELLNAAGFEHLTIYENGGALMKSFNQVLANAEKQGKTVTDQIDLIVSDIEMPQLDGLSLCKMIKEKAPTLPVIVLSSMITDQMIEKCKSVGADNYLSKRHFPDLPDLIDKTLEENRNS